MNNIVSVDGLKPALIPVIKIDRNSVECQLEQNNTLSNSNGTIEHEPQNKTVKNKS